LGSI
jgi:hypothetical protein